MGNPRNAAVELAVGDEDHSPYLLFYQPHWNLIKRPLAERELRLMYGAI